MISLLFNFILCQDFKMKQPKLIIEKIYPNNGTIFGGTNVLVTFRLISNLTIHRYCYCKFDNHVVSGEVPDIDFGHNAICRSPPGSNLKTVNFSFSLDRLTWAPPVDFTYIPSPRFSIWIIFLPCVLFFLIFFSAALFAAIQKNKRRSKKKNHRNRVAKKVYNNNLYTEEIVTKRSILGV